MFDLDNIANIKGFNEITANQGMFQLFLRNFINSFGVSTRATIEPISVEFCNTSEGKYLKFVYEINKRREWMHVNSPNNWW